ncbi:hypothetical protein ACFSKN_13700 [Mariniflexile gromovii]|uniref:Uncharacterized protein n=1 Tax=Mariniflexile gromovii TaxID=362523 RepID=A0ABS4BR75_9FLAO|nr:hypothetical protein [Mariniflexile gromovii]MBP0903022.1 hypothetical protein [Mariniflexile gromovii]
MTLNITTECFHLASVNLQDSLTYNILKDFVFPFILALIGALVAWLVFIRQIVSDRKNELNAKKEDIKNKLTYFSMIVNNAIENSKGQNKNIKDLIYQIDNSGIDSIPLTKHVTYDLKILAEKIDKEDYLLSYLKFYSKENKKKLLNEFKEILDSCGIINDIFIQINNDLESKQVLEFELKKNYNLNLDNWSDAFGGSLVYLKEKNDPLFFELFKIQENSNKIKHINLEKSIWQQHEKLLLPTLFLLDKAHSEHKEFDDNLGNLWILTNQTIHLFNNLEQASKQIKTMLTQQSELVNNQIAVLEKASQKLRNIFLD